MRSSLKWVSRLASDPSARALWISAGLVSESCANTIRAVPAVPTARNGHDIDVQIGGPGDVVAEMSGIGDLAAVGRPAEIIRAAKRLCRAIGIDAFHQVDRLAGRLPTLRRILLHRQHKQVASLTVCPCVPVANE